MFLTSAVNLPKPHNLESNDFMKYRWEKGPIDDDSIEREAQMMRAAQGGDRND